jgi:hypothetical protein
MPGSSIDERMTLDHKDMHHPDMVLEICEAMFEGI